MHSRRVWVLAHTELCWTRFHICCVGFVRASPWIWSLLSSLACWPAQRLKSSSFLNNILSASLTDVGRICVDEFGILVQISSDFFLQADLKVCSLRLL